jgi:hypothetical protein
MPAELALAESLLPFAAVNGDGAWSPPVDVREHPAQYTVVADVGRRRLFDDHRRPTRPPGCRGSSRPARAADGETPPLAPASRRL